MSKGSKVIQHGVKVNDAAEVFIKCQSTEPVNATLAKNEVVIYLDEGGNKLKFKAKYSTGNVSIGEIAIT